LANDNPREDLLMVTVHGVAIRAACG
jgi:hypothetical protein